VQDAHPLTVHAFWTDTLGFFGSVGYISSSALTLTVRDVLSEVIFNVQMFTAGVLTDLLPSTSWLPIEVTHSTC